MRIVRGRGPTPARDHELTQELVRDVVETGQPVVRVWQPHPQIVFGRRDANRAGYDRARAIAAERGFSRTERAVGGHAVCYTGHTVAFARVRPVEEMRTGITARYERAMRETRRALDDLGVAVTEGEPDGAFCPGSHSLSGAGKIVGLAQRVTQGTAVVGGIVVVRDHAKIADVLAPIYDALEIPFDRDATGSIARAGGDHTTEQVLRTLEDELSRGEPTIESVRET